MKDASIKTWRHSRKGLITGRIIRESGEWVDIELFGTHELTMLSGDGYREHGEVIQVRKDFLTEVEG